VILAAVLAPHCLTAQDFGSVVERIFAAGKPEGEITYLEFRDKGLRQYAVAQGTDADHLVRVSFIEENWTRSGDKDVIDQWVLRVETDGATMRLYPMHRKLVEHDSKVLSIEELSTEGMQQVVQRIINNTAPER
jgi:hypothetical protein